MSVKNKVCLCGCGGFTNRIKRTSKKRGHVIGQFFKFIEGHARRSKLSLEERKLRNNEYAKNWKAKNPKYKETWLANNPKYTQEYCKRFPWATIVASAIWRCKKTGIPCDISYAWARRVWTGKCAISGIPFAAYIFRKSKKGFGPSPYAASLDRIDPKKGYTERNCRFILFALNAFKGTSTDSEMRKIAKAFLKYRG